MVLNQFGNFFVLKQDWIWIRTRSMRIHITEINYTHPFCLILIPTLHMLKKRGKMNKTKYWHQIFFFSQGLHRDFYDKKKKFRIIFVLAVPKVLKLGDETILEKKKKIIWEKLRSFRCKAKIRRVGGWIFVSF